MRQIQRLLAIGLMILSLVAVGGCASTGDESKSGDSKSSEAAPAAAMAPVPKGSKLAKVEAGMSEQQVRLAIGEPSDIRGYPTGKNWIPFYFGGDTYRQDWTYPGVGKVIFSNSSRWSRTMTVVDRVADPNQK